MSAFGVKWTLVDALQMSAFDPKRTSAESQNFSASCAGIAIAPMNITCEPLDCREVLHSFISGYGDSDETGAGTELTVLTR
jgi:hypothetical protein